MFPREKDKSPLKLGNDAPFALHGSEYTGLSCFMWCYVTERNQV